MSDYSDYLVDRQDFPVQVEDKVAYYDIETLKQEKLHLTITKIVKIAPTESGAHRVWITNRSGGWRILHPSEFVLVPSIEEMEWTG